MTGKRLRLTGREIAAFQIAALCQLPRFDGFWRVPSLSTPGASYTVDTAQGVCTCPDSTVRKVVCKHLLAVRYTMQREGI